MKLQTVFSISSDRKTSLFSAYKKLTLYLRMGLAICCGTVGDEDVGLFVAKKPFEIVLDYSYLQSKAAEAQPNWNVVFIDLRGLYDLPDIGNVLGMSGPFVEFKLLNCDDNQLQRSSYKEIATIVKWDTFARYQFVINPEERGKLVLSVYNYNAMGSHQPIGDSIFDAKKLSPDGTKTIQKLKLTNQDGEKQGEIEVAITCIPFHQALNTQIQECYEYQRWQVGLGWGSSPAPGHFLPLDPGRYSTLDFSLYGSDIDSVVPPMQGDWKITRHWSVEATDQDADGWEYSYRFNEPTWFPTAESSDMVVRRRKYTRELSKAS